MAKTVRFTIRFSLENNIDRELWELISQVPSGQRSAFIKGFLYACMSRGNQPKEISATHRPQEKGKVPLQEVRLPLGDL